MNKVCGGGFAFWTNLAVDCGVIFIKFQLFTFLCQGFVIWSLGNIRSKWNCWQTALMTNKQAFQSLRSSWLMVAGRAARTVTIKQRQSKNILKQDSNQHLMDYWSIALPIKLMWIVFRMSNFSRIFGHLPLSWCDCDVLSRGFMFK